MLTLTIRNIRLYFTDRVAVFLSLLGSLIAILIVLVFLRQVLVDSLTSATKLITVDQGSHVLDSWLIASACVIACATTGLGALRQFVDDRETKRWRDFLVTPLPRWKITAGYLLASALISMVMTTIVLVLGTAYCHVRGVPLTFRSLGLSWVWLMVCCLSFTALMGFLVSFLRSNAAFTGLSIVIGVLFGFLSETYVARANLPHGVAHVLETLPFAQASALVRQSYTSPAIAALDEAVRAPTMETMGITLSLGSTTVTPAMVVTVLVAVAVVFCVGSWQIITHTVQR
jgi:multidrug/hemolysin transport system permease protein